jgi:hypothetical protein
MDRARGPGDMFKRVGQVLADPRRGLPDGRLVIELAPSSLELTRYQAHAGACCARWENAAADVGAASILTLLACRGCHVHLALVAVHRLVRLVDEFVRRLDEPERWRSAWELDNRRRLGDPPGGVSSEELRLVLLAGPDRLDAATARFCLRAGLSALLPQDCGLPPVRRRPLPPGYFAIVEIDTGPPASGTGGA